MLLSCSRALGLLGLLGVVQWLQCHAREYPIDNNVLLLDDESFAHAIEDHDLLLVEFYAPWCGHCKKLAPEWDAAAATLSNENSVVKLAKVDAVESKQLYKQFDIRSFPTIYFFKNQHKIPYKGARNADAIVTWVRKHSKPPVSQLDSIDALVEAQRKTDVVVLGYFPGFSTDLMQQKRNMFYNIAETFDHLEFFETQEESLAVYTNMLDENRIDTPHIFILKSFDRHITTEQPLRLDRKIVTESVMTDFVKQNSYELFPKFSRDTAKKIFAPRILTHGWIIIDPDSVDYQDHLRDIYFLANEYKGRVQFIQLSSHDEAYLKQFDVDLDSLPTLILMDVNTMTQYHYEGLFEWSPLSAYTSQMLNGTASRYRKSEKVESEDTTGSITVLRASSFKELVLGHDNDVMIFFYASWCGHCQSFMPTYEELGDTFRSNENIVVAKIDAIENDVDDIMKGIVVESFPTLYYISGSKNGKSAMLYDGSRNLVSMIEFINDKISTESVTEL